MQQKKQQNHSFEDLVKVAIIQRRFNQSDCTLSMKHKYLIILLITKHQNLANFYCFSLPLQVIETCLKITSLLKILNFNFCFLFFG